MRLYSNRTDFLLYTVSYMSTHNNVLFYTHWYYGGNLSIFLALDISHAAVTRTCHSWERNM